MDMAKIGPSKDTRPERVMRMLLVRSGYRHLRNHKGVPGRPDFMLLSPMVAVFVDGVFWHHPRSKARRISPFWDDKLAKNVARDRRTNRRLRAMGIRVVRIWDRSMRLGWRRRLLKAIESEDWYVRL